MIVEVDLIHYSVFLYFSEIVFNAEASVLVINLLLQSHGKISVHGNISFRKVLMFDYLYLVVGCNDHRKTPSKNSELLDLCLIFMIYWDLPVYLFMSLLSVILFWLLFG